MTALTTSALPRRASPRLLLGWASDRWVARGIPEGPLRKGLMAFAHLTIAGAIVGIAISQSTFALALWLVLAGIGTALISTNLYCLAQMFAGPRAAGGWIGIQNALGNVSGIIGPIVTGLIIDRLGGYNYAFAVAAAVLRVSASFGGGWWSRRWNWSRSIAKLRHESDHPPQSDVRHLAQDARNPARIGRRRDA